MKTLLNCKRRCRCFCYLVSSNPPLPPPGCAATLQLQVSKLSSPRELPVPIVWKCLWDWASGVLNYCFGSPIAVPWLARLNHFPSHFWDGKALLTPFFLARAPKVIYVKSTAFRCAGYPRTKPTMPTHILWQRVAQTSMLRHVLPLPQCRWKTWRRGHPCNHFSPRHCWNAAPQLQISVFPFRLMYGEHPPAIDFYSSSVLQKHYKMEIVRAQEQGQSLHS